MGSNKVQVKHGHASAMSHINGVSAPGAIGGEIMVRAARRDGPNDSLSSMPRSGVSTINTKNMNSVRFCPSNQEMTSFASDVNFVNCRALRSQVSPRYEVGTAGVIGTGGCGGGAVPTPPKVPQVPLPASSQQCESTCQVCESLHIDEPRSSQPSYGTEGGSSSIGARDTDYALWVDAGGGNICPEDCGYNNNIPSSPKIIGKKDNVILESPFLETASFSEVHDVLPFVNKLDNELVAMMGRWSADMTLGKAATCSLDSVEPSSFGIGKEPTLGKVTITSSIDSFIGATIATMEKVAEETTVGKEPTLALTGNWWSQALHESTESIRLSGSENIASMMEDVAMLGAQLDHLLSVQAQLLGGSNIICSPSSSCKTLVQSMTWGKNKNDIECNFWPAEPYNPLKYCTT